MPAPGGKAAHVAIALQALGADPLWIGFAGGPSGRDLVSGLTEIGISVQAIPMEQPTRVNLAIVDDSRLVTEILEPGGSGGSGRSGAAGTSSGSGTSRGSDADALARAAAAIGPREVVVRDASIVGALADGAWRAIDIRRDAVVDAIGAGDAFNAGYISARLRGQSIEDALELAVRCGTAVTTSVSDTAGFPRTPH